MTRGMLLSGAAALLLGAAPVTAIADGAIGTSLPVQVAQAAAGEVDAGSLIGKEVYDANGDKVGEIDSVMVDQNGKVTSVVMDVSGWLESEKLVAVNWSDLKTGEDGKIVTALTKESATSAEAYNYKDPNLRGQVLTESGERYAEGDAPADADADADATATTGAATGTETETTAESDADAAAPADADNAAGGSAVVNADGSLNASKLIGLDVQSQEDQKVGDIGEVVLDKSGKVQGVVVDVGGFLGIATHPVLLDWKDVTLASEDGNDRAVVNLSKEKLEQMPAYESSSR